MESYAHEHTGKLEVSWDRFGQLCRDLAMKIHREYQPDVVVGVARAGVIPGVVIASMFRKEFYTIKISRRENDRVVHARPILFVPITESVYGKRVLLVDEISISGETLRIAREEVQNKAAREVRTATLFVHGISKKPDYFALESDAMIINPWSQYIIGQSGDLEVHPEYVDGSFPDRN